MKKIVLSAFILFSTFFSWAQNSSENSGVERYAIFVGSNVGGEKNQRLMYAGTDAIAFQKTMSEIGGISSANAILLLDPSKEDLNNAMQTISKKILDNGKKSKRSEFLFYYSGHSDENSLLLGKAKYDYSSLKTAITNVPSDIHVVILDSCYSGNFIRTKGGMKKKPFLFDDSSVVKGHAYLSSSSSQEFSQESDEIGSSFFTNAMLTGLRGAADSSGDKKVTLNELYSYAFNETLSKTEKTSAGPQHPNYNITLVGSGDLVLSDISASDSVLMLSSSIKGRVILRSRNGNLVSEINKVDNKPIFLALEKGDYTATVITKDKTLQGTFYLKSDKVFELTADSLSTVSETRNRVRGEDSSEEENEESENQPSFYAKVLDDETVYVPVDFSFVNNEISRAFGKKIVTSVSFALIRSSVYKVNGAMFSCINNEADYVNGLQSASIFNTAGNVNGVQSSSIFNKVKEDIHGAQFAGVFNLAGGNVHGPQFAGVFNQTKTFEGAQFAGVLNLADSFKGLQMAGVCNYTKQLPHSAVQIGVINIAEESDGLQLGLINYSKNGIFEFGLSFTSNSNIKFALNSGNKHLYSILGYSVAADNFYDFKNFHKDKFWSVFFGLGTRVTAGPVNFDFEILGNNTYHKEKEDSDSSIKNDFDTINTYLFPSVKFSAGITPVKHLQIFTAINFAFEYEKNKDAFEHMTKRIKFNKDNCTVYPDFEMGVRYSLN